MVAGAYAVAYGKHDLIQIVHNLLTQCRVVHADVVLTVHALEMKILACGLDCRSIRFECSWPWYHATQEVGYRLMSAAKVSCICWPCPKANESDNTVFLGGASQTSKSSGAA